MKFKKLHPLYTVCLLLLAFEFYRYSYLVITPRTVEYTLETLGGPKTLEIPGR